MGGIHINTCFCNQYPPRAGYLSIPPLSPGRRTRYSYCCINLVLNVFQLENACWRCDVMLYARYHSWYQVPGTCYCCTAAVRPTHRLGCPAWRECPHREHTVENANKRTTYHRRALQSARGKQQAGDRHIHRPTGPGTPQKHAAVYGLVYCVDCTRNPGKLFPPPSHDPHSHLMMADLMQQPIHPWSPPPPPSAHPLTISSGEEEAAEVQRQPHR